MTESESLQQLTPEQEAILQDVVQQLGIERDCLEILPLSLVDWPDQVSVYFILRKDRHGRIFYHYVSFDGEIYSPFVPDGLERLLKRLLSSRRFDLNAEQLINLLLMYNRPEPMMTFISNIERDISPSSRKALEIYYGITDLAPVLTELEEDRKVVFWTLNVRRELLKRWTAYFNKNGRVRVSEEVKIALQNAREGYE